MQEGTIKYCERWGKPNAPHHWKAWLQDTIPSLATWAKLRSRRTQLPWGSMPKSVRTTMLYSTSIFWFYHCPIAITVAVAAKGHLSPFCLRQQLHLYSSSNATISCTSEVFVWSCSQQGQQQNAQMTLEQDEMNHDIFSVCLHIEAKAIYYFFLMGDTSVSPHHWVKKKKKKNWNKSCLIFKQTPKWKQLAQK